MDRTYVVLFYLSRQSALQFAIFIHPFIHTDGGKALSRPSGALTDNDHQGDFIHNDHQKCYSDDQIMNWDAAAMSVENATAKMYHSA